MNDILTPEELEELTGYNQAAGQESVLRNGRIHFITGKDGKIKTTWSWVHRAPWDGLPGNDEAPSGPDLSRVNG